MGHGDRWAAVEKDYEDFIGEMLPLICQGGTLAGKNAFTHSLDDVPNKAGVVYGLQYLEPRGDNLDYSFSLSRSGPNDL